MTHSAKGRHGETSPERLRTREREIQAFELRKAGVGYHEIGAALGITKQAAHQMVKRVLARTAKEMDADVQAVRNLEVARLDALLFGLWPRARAGHEGAIDRVIKIMQMRAELLGLYSPKKSNVDLTHHADQDAVARLTTLLDRRLAALGTGSTVGEPGLSGC